MKASQPKIGLLLPTRGLLLQEGQPLDVDLVLRMAERAEAAGLDLVWVGDSLTAKPRLEPLATLAAVAASTRRVRLGTAVLLAALRHPTLLAQTAHTVDALSGGRLTLGMGVGGAFTEGQRREWLAAGVDPSERARRFEEVVEVFTRLGREESVTFHGRSFQLDDVRLQPRPVQPGGVPVLLAAHLRTGSEAQHRRAARLGDGFMSISEQPDGFAQVAERVRRYARECGRDPDALDAAMYITVNIDRDEARAGREADRFIRAYYGINMWEDLSGPLGRPERVVERVRAFHAAGANTVIVRFASFEQEEQLGRFLEEVWPALQQ